MPEKNNKNILYCSFCGKSQHEVRKLIAGPTVFICDECVELCMDIIKEENKDSFVNNQEGVPTPQEICKVLDEYVIGQEKTKKKLTLSISSKKPYKVSQYKQDKQKTSVVIEKKTSGRSGERKFYNRESNLQKTSSGFRNKIKFMSNAPAVIVNILKGIGVKPAVKIIQKFHCSY